MSTPAASSAAAAADKPAAAAAASIENSKPAKEGLDAPSKEVKSEITQDGMRIESNWYAHTQPPPRTQQRTAAAAHTAPTRTANDERTEQHGTHQWNSARTSRCAHSLTHWLAGSLARLVRCAAVLAQGPGCDVVR